MRNPKHLYRVRVLSYPEGSFHCVDETEDMWVPDPGWSPPHWRPEGRYVEILGTSEFIWPTTNKVYASRTTAKRRAELLESFGATAVVERSNAITWPEEES